MSFKNVLKCAMIAFFAAIACSFVSFSRADVRLPEIFVSHMVLQRDMKVPVWGFADVGERVTVSFEGQTQTAQTGSDGRWSVNLEPLKPGGPFTMTVKGNNELTLENVLVGDVWLCSGQSNMEWSMNASPDSRAEIPSVNNSNIRLFHVTKSWKQQPQDKLEATWKPCDPESVTHFSAVGYYFGAMLQADLGVPIGLINSSWGGTRIEPWTPPIGFDMVPSLSNTVYQIAAKDPRSRIHKELVAKTIVNYKTWVEETERGLAAEQPIAVPPKFPEELVPFANHQQPTVLYNAMAHPLVPLAMKGAIWYQGESNRGEGMLYADKMKALIQGWRSVFKNEDLGFYYVQLAPYNYGNNPEALPLIWVAQASVEKELPKTGMAVINDIGNLKDIHPANKKIVGRRLALLALNRTYGKTDVVCASPTFKEMSIDGAAAILRFDNAKKLQTRDGKEPSWFEIAGSDGVYHKASAVIDGTSIRLSADAVSKPYAVRFAWSMLAEPNVQNEAGLQLGAFRAGEIPERGIFDSLVPEGKNYKLLYHFNPTDSILDGNRERLVYTTDKSREIAGKIKRVGYFLYLVPQTGDGQFVFVTMPPLAAETAKLGVPTKASGARFQQKVADVTVRSNVPEIKNGTFAEGCNVEFWDCNYSQANAAGIPGASGDKFDFGDQIHPNVSPGYGSMQIHNYAAKQTIFAFNAFGRGKDSDLGIGNRSKGPHPDWTFSNSAKEYKSGQFLILVETE